MPNVPMLRGASIAQLFAAILDGLDDLPEGERLMVRGKLVDPATLKATLQPALAFFEAVDAAHALWVKTLMDRNEAMPELLKLCKAVIKGVEVYCGEDVEKLLRFGLKPEKARRRLTSEEEMARVEKLRRTRKALKTMGKKQKKAAKEAMEARLEQGEGTGSGTS